MDGDDERFPAPDPNPPDPSLEELLRRARDARLANDWGPTAGLSPHFRPLPSARDDRFTRRLPGWASFLVGLAGGLALASLVPMHGALTGQLSVGRPTASPATAPIPAPTTPTPAPMLAPAPTTVIPAAPPPTAAAIVALVQAFYDTQGPFAGTYMLREVTALQIQGRDGAQLRVCIAYEAAAVSAPDTVVGANTRRFTLVAGSDGNWQVAQMDGPDSCSLR